MNETDWIQSVNSLIDRCTRELISLAAMDGALDTLCMTSSSPYEALEIHIKRTGKVDMVAGRALSREMDMRKTVVFESDQYSATVTGWIKDGETDSDATQRAVVGLVKAWFAEERRTHARSGLIVKDAPGVASAAAAAVDALARAEGQASVLFADLDRLKELNSELGQSVVDERILEPLAIVLEEAVVRPSISIHRSGDEYLFLCPGAPHEALAQARRLQEAIAAHDFGGSDVRISVGIAAVTDGTTWADLDALEATAEAAMKPPGEGARDKQRRGRTSLAVLDTPRVLTGAVAPALASTIVKAGVAADAPFGDPWLNYITRTMQGAFAGSVAEAEAALDSLIDWIAPRWTTSLDGVICANESSVPTLSPASVAFACAHALFRIVFVNGVSGLNCDDSDDVRLAFADSCGFAVKWGGNRLRSGVLDGASTVDLGGFVLRDTTLDAGLFEPRRALLLRIGHQYGPGQNQVFADVITADDRPSTGGALPDFWEGSVARVVTRLRDVPDLTTVAIVGEEASAQRTVERLRNVALWRNESEELSRRTGLSETELRSASERLEGRVAVFPTYSAAIESLADAMSATVTLTSRSAGGADAEQASGFLTLRADLTAFALPSVAGCRVDTAAQAFPVVLQLLKDSSSAAGAMVVDQAGVQMIDVIDFKLQVGKPHTAQIPAFYLSDEAELEAYFQDAFLAEGGLFQRALQPQLARFLSHLTHAMAGPEQFSTRRAILVVPVPPTNHADPEGRELSPLGLVSIRAIPRLMSRRWHMTFSFTWRTVEALVGLPYSLYGSLRYAEHLTAALQERSAGESLPLSLSEVSYVAHSLHMANDVYSRQVARRIIQLAAA
ncbi:MAG: hypothetical protein V7607_5139 [Solirubrobacteraceae bacterium]